MTPLRTSVRLLFLAGAGIGTFYLSSQWAGGGGDAQSGLDDLVVQPATRRLSSTTGDTDKASTAPAALLATPTLPGNDERVRSIPGSAGKLFAQLSWSPPPPPPPPPAPPAPQPKPAAPVTPTLPFTFVGMLERGAAKPAAFVAKGETLLVISAGDMLENNTYRVESLNANEIVMTYLPMNIQQALSFTGRAK